MLLILFGSTSEMGYRSRQYFQKHHFELIKKYHYVPHDNILKERFEPRSRDLKETVLGCDFIYENNGMYVGFNKEQIIDAVRGRKNCLLTASANTVDFIKQIKSAYGDYVVTVGTYIDRNTLQKMFEVLPDISEEELSRRMETGEQVKQKLIEDRKFFDHIVIYGGKDTSFDYSGLKTQYDYILKQAEKRQKQLNDKMYVEMPYSGNDDYVFISYSHEDMEQVFPILHQLQLSGCRIWYDEGINGGENWRKILASKIDAANCKDFLLFSSKNSTQSRHIQAEINAALNCGKKITTIRLDNAQFQLEIEMYLQTYQSLFSQASSFYDKILSSLEKTVFVEK